MKRLPERSYITTRKVGKMDRKTQSFQEDMIEKTIYQYNWDDIVVEDENDENESIEIAELFQKQMNEIVKIILKELYLGNRIVTSQANEIFEGLRNENKLEMGKEYEVIGFQYSITRKIVLVERTFYEGVMMKDDDESKRLQTLYLKIRNGCNDVGNYELKDKTTIAIGCEEFATAFKYMTISIPNRNDKITITRNEDIVAIEATNDNENNNEIKECEICWSNIKRHEKYVKLTDEKEEYFVHRSCYFYVPCQRCGTKENITYDDVNNRFYCETCFEEIKKIFRYQRMKRMRRFPLLKHKVNEK